MKKMNSVKALGLVKGRHEIVHVTEYIFEQVEDVHDFDAMAKQVEGKLQGTDMLVLYVTGLTACLVEVIKYCQANNVSLTLMHYDRDTNDYVAQYVV